MLDESTGEVAKAVIRDLIDKRITIALTDLRRFLECMTDDTAFDRCGVARLADYDGALLFMEVGTDKLMYSLTFDELLQAHSEQDAWTRLLTRVGGWVRSVQKHYSGSDENGARSFSYEASEARGLADLIRSMRPDGGQG